MMSFAIDDKRETGISFIDDCHPIISSFVNSITEHLSNDKDTNHILELIDSLIKQIDMYLQSKTDCSDQFDCKQKIISTEPLHRLLDLRRIIEKHGPEMHAYTIAHEIRYWARSSVFEKDEQCINCRAKPLPSS